MNLGTVTYVHLEDLDHPVAIIRPDQQRAVNYTWRGLGESSVIALSGTSGDCTIPFGGCLAVDWPGKTQGGVYFTPNLLATGPNGPYNWFGTLADNGGGTSGLLYRRNRYFDVVTGRFTQQDPIGVAGGTNLYGFADGDPVNFSDPFGLCPKSAGGDGATDKISDCPRGSSGWWAWRDAQGVGSSIINRVMGVWATFNFDMQAQLPKNTLIGEFNLPVGPFRSAARLTTSQAADLASWLGYTKRVKDAPFSSMGQAVFTNGKNFISLDVTMHAGVEATWKLFSHRGQRIGTFNYDLSKLLGR